MFYRQCTLRLGSTEQVSWIPEEFAIKNKFLEVKGENGWQVTHVGARKADTLVHAHEREYLKHRSVTDI